MTRKLHRTFLSQLTQRKVTRVALAYIVIGWLVMQVGEVTFEALNLPSWTLTLLIVFVLLGFPIALVIAWAYEVTPEGIRKDLAGTVSAGDTGKDYLNGSKPSIAVLPFYDMSEHGDQGYFCEGLAEEILNSLCKVEGLGVASRIASFQFGSKRADVIEIGRKLRVKTVLEGTVRKSGDKLRITVELVKTSDGYHLWSRQYDRTMQDVFDVQEDIADSIVKRLSLTLDHDKASQGQQCDPRAYELLLRGNSLVAMRTMRDIVNARQIFNRALDVDPDCGRAWAGLAATYGFEYMYYNATDVNREEALRTSNRAVELAPERVESHVLAGIANCITRNYGMADAEFRKAIDLEPRNFEAFYYFARTKVREGELEEALKLFERAARVRPEDYESVLFQAQLHVSLGHQKQARAVSHEGIARVRNALELNPDDNRALNLGAFALLRLGETREASIIRYNAACFYALKGDSEKALDCLENCLVKVGQVNREWLEHDSDLDSIRDHPRYAGIIASITDNATDPVK
jgi:TolB-like protein/Flp pilus assembly protein TadD